MFLFILGIHVHNAFPHIIFYTQHNFDDAIKFTSELVNYSVKESDNIKNQKEAHIQRTKKI